MEEYSIYHSCVIQNERGIHTKPAALTVQLCSQYNADIFLSNSGGKEISASSILDIMMLELCQGTEVQIRAQGSDASEAAAALIEFFTGYID